MWIHNGGICCSAFARILGPSELRSNTHAESSSSKKQNSMEKRGKPVILGNPNDPSSLLSDWDALDQHVNEYPGNRTFKVIGSGGEDFLKSMRSCVEAVVGKLDDKCIKTRPSSEGNYLSVTFGPILIETPEQFKDIYNSMKQDSRMKFFI